MRAEEIGDKNKEHLFGVGLSAANQIKYIELISLGSIDKSVVDNADILRFAIIKNCERFILAHNHSPNDSAPSEADIQVTLDVGMGAFATNITLVDHIIVTESEYYSFAENKQIYDYRDVYKLFNKMSTDRILKKSDIN